MQEFESKTLPVVALRGLVLFPHMVLHFDIGRKKSAAALNAALDDDERLLFLATQKDIENDNPTQKDLYPVGVVAKVRQVMRVPGGDTVRVIVEGGYRGVLSELSKTEPYLCGEIIRVEDKVVKDTDKFYEEALVRQIKERFSEYAEVVPKLAPDMMLTILGEDNGGALADFIAANIALKYEDKQMILSENDTLRRMEKLLVILARETNLLTIEAQIEERVQEQMDKNQREYYLREQIKAISDELDEGDNPQDDAQKYREKIISFNLKPEIEEKLLDDCSKLYKMGPGSHEATVLRNYLDTIIALPWNVYPKDNYKLSSARKTLDKDHYGMNKVKERIIEMLAVRKLSPDITGQILCLAGPPGVGKTSIAKSVAKAIGRKFARVSLGGVRDEAEIRGHRKTYIGAMPGRIMDAVRQAGSNNAVILLDEVDKLGADFKGDPSSALLEALDGEQNGTFRDHYIEVPYDLSKILFITTANDKYQIPEPLLDRMEVIDLTSYTHEEKFQIAKKHLVPKQIKRHGMNSKNLKIKDEVIHELISGYTREAGVRNLERTISSLCRKAAVQIADGETEKVTISASALESLLGPRKFREEHLDEKDEIGVVTGLAWTSVGGETLCVEVAVMDGTGKLELTGNLGDVMKESAHAAVTYLRSHADEYHIPKNFYKDNDIHIHVPEGAVPKDGPSAGVTMATALLSALTNTPVRRDVAMTGEITLRGRVTAIGGLKEKTMAAYRKGIRKVIIPKENEPDLAEIDPVVKEAVEFVTASNLSTVFASALVKYNSFTDAAETPKTVEKDKKSEVFPPKHKKDGTHPSITQ